MTASLPSTYNKNTNSQMNDWGLMICDLNRTTTLVADTAQSVTVPTTGGCLGASTSRTNKFYYAVFGVAPAGAAVFVSNTGTAVIPTGSFSSTGSEMIKPGMGRRVQGGSTLSFITHDAAGAVISVAFFPTE